MKQNSDTYTFFSILAFVAAILVFAGIVGGSFELGSIGWLVLVLLAAGVGLMGAAMAANRNATSTAVVPTQSTPSGSSLTVPGTEVPSASAQSTVSEEVTSPQPPEKVIGSDANASGEVEVTPQRDTVEPDDLTKLEGIGPKMSQALIAGGVTSFEKLSQMSLDDIRAVLDEQGQRFAPAAESWAEQASFAAKDDWDGLNELQDSLIGGRYPTEN